MNTDSKSSATPTQPGPRFAIALALGPVGRFISAGRRSRDLWYGSRLLAEMTRQAVDFLCQKDNAQTEFWTPDTENDRLKLRFFDASGLHRYEGPVISNKVRAIVHAPNADAVRVLLQATEAHVRGWLVEQLEQNKDEQNDRVGVDLQAFEAQKDGILQGDFLEFYAGFKMVGSDEYPEHAALKRAQTLRDARKNARIFGGPSWTRAGHVRSSLEPGRDAVLIQYDRDDKPDEAFTTRLNREIKGIRSSEKLDAIGLLRRFAAMKEEDSGRDQLLPDLPFPPLSRVTADPWISGIQQAKGDSRAALREIFHTLMALECATGPGRTASRDALHLLSSPCREPGNRSDATQNREWLLANGFFPYDASLLFEGAVIAKERELQTFKKQQRRAGVPDKAAESVEVALRTLHRLKRPIAVLHKAVGVPPHYYALLTADGDGVGSVLSALENQPDELVLVQALDRFAEEACEIIGDNSHRGFAFYVGGDELSGYLPVDTVLLAALKLADTFDHRVRMCGVAGADKLTLSIGIVIAHSKHDLRDVRNRAQKCLEKAKDRRREDVRLTGTHASWIQVNESTAGGGDRISAGRTADYVHDLLAWTTLLKKEKLSLSTAHGLLQDLHRLKGVLASRTQKLDSDVVEAQKAHAIKTGLTLALAGPLLKHKRSRGDSALPVDRDPDPWFMGRLKKLQDEIGEATDLAALKKASANLTRMANEIILASRILEVQLQRVPRGSKSEETQS